MTVKFTAVAEEAAKKVIEDLCNQIAFAEMVCLNSADQEIMKVFIGRVSSGEWIEQKIPAFKDLSWAKDVNPQFKSLKKAIKRGLRQISYVQMVFLNEAREPLFHMDSPRATSGCIVTQQVPIFGSMEITLL